MGVPVRQIKKIGEGSPHVVDLIRERQCDLVINTPTGSGARADGYEIRSAAVRHGIPCVTTMTGASAAARAIAAQRGERRRSAEPAGAPCGGQGCRRSPVTERVLAPFGRRVCEVVGNHASGGYRVFSLRDGMVRRRRRGSSTCWPPSAVGSSAPSDRSCRVRSRSPTPRSPKRACDWTFSSRASARGPSGYAV